MTKEKRLLARDDHVRDSPAWSPDGSRLVYSWMRESARGLEFSVAMRTTSSADETLLATPAGSQVQSHAWSPDGRIDSVVVARTGTPSWPTGRLLPRRKRTQRPQLWSKTLREILAGALLAKWPMDQFPVEPSRSGHRLCHSERRASGSGHRVDAPDRPARVGRQAALVLGWELLYVWRSNGSFFHVWALPFDEARGIASGNPFQVTHFDSPSHRIWGDLGNAEPSVSRNRMTLPMVDATGNIWMLDHVDK